MPVKLNTRLGTISPRSTSAMATSCPLEATWTMPRMTAASRPRNKTAWPLLSLAASAGLTASAGMSSSAVSTGEQIGEVSLAGGRSMTQRLQAVPAKSVALAERADPAAAQALDMAEGAERTAEVARQRAHIGALAAFGCRARHDPDPASRPDRADGWSTARGASSTVSPSRARS